MRFCTFLLALVNGWRHVEYDTDADGAANRITVRFYHPLAF